MSLIFIAYCGHYGARIVIIMPFQCAYDVVAML